MILREFFVLNYRPFREERFAISERVTVIAGVNGRGKSAILDGIALLLSRLVPQITPAQGGYKYLKPQDIHHGQQTLCLALSGRFELIPVEFAIDYDETTGLHSTKLLPQVKKSIKEIYGDPNRIGDAAPIAVYYTTDRAAYRLPKRLLTGLPQDQHAAYHGALSNRQVDFRNFMSRYRVWYESVKSNQDPGDRNQRTLKAIDRAIQEFLPGFSDVRVETNPLRLLVSKNGHPFNLTQLSDGERSVFAMLIDLCRRLTLANPELDPLQGAGVVLIDELELHLHPKWQREIVEKLRSTFPNIQFIATTHSPFIIQSLKPGELINLDPDEFAEHTEYADKSIEDIAENVMGVEMPQKSERYQRMMKAAEEYFRLLREPQPQAEAIEAVEQRLNELAAPFSDDPAFQALLKLERETKQGGDDATG